MTAPIRTHATLGDLNAMFMAAPTVAGQVRLLLEFRLTEWGIPHLTWEISQIAGELIANAVAATPDGEIGVRFAREQAAALLGVWDSSECMPAAKPVVELSADDVTPDAQALDRGHNDGTGGWGLPIVQALSFQCGVSKTTPSGKWVWSRIKF